MALFWQGLKIHAALVTPHLDHDRNWVRVRRKKAWSRIHGCYPDQLCWFSPF